MNTFRTFYKENKERLFGYLLRKTGDTHLAADIMQESFTRYLERYQDKEQSPSLLFTISRNLFYDYARKKSRDIPFDENHHGVDTDQESIYSIREQSRRVLAALGQLDEEEQDLMAFVVSSGLSYREISAITGMTETNIKVKIHRTRLKLKKILQQEGL